MSDSDNAAKKKALRKSHADGGKKIRADKAMIREKAELLGKLKADRRNLIPRVANPARREEMVRSNEKEQAEITDFLDKFADGLENQFKGVCQNWIDGEITVARTKTGAERAMQYLQQYDIIRPRVHQLGFMLVELEELKKDEVVAGR